MCGTAFTQGCMLGHAKDEFQDDLSSVSTFFWHWHRGDSFERYGVVTCVLQFWLGKRGVLTFSKLESKLEFDMIKQALYFWHDKTERAALEND